MRIALPPQRLTKRASSGRDVDHTHGKRIALSSYLLPLTSELGLWSASDRQHAVIVEAGADGRERDNAAEDHPKAAAAVAE